MSGATPPRHPDRLPGRGLAEHGPVRRHAPGAPAAGWAADPGSLPPLPTVPHPDPYPPYSIELTLFQRLCHRADGGTVDLSLID